MPEPKENRKFYIRAPSLEYRLGGPIRLGHVLKDAFSPQDPIYTLNPVPKSIEGVPFAQNTVERERHGSMNMCFAAKIYEAFGAQAKASGERVTKTEYTFDRVQPWYFETNPNAADAKALIAKSPEVKAALQNGPVYVITGLNVAEGLKYSNHSTADMKAGASGNAHVTDEVELEGELEGSAGRRNLLSYTVLGDAILAYRLHIIKEVGWAWKRDYEVEAYDPGNAGFLDIQQKKAEVGVDAEDLSLDDLNGFIDENEYEEAIRKLGFWDEEGEVVLICVDT
jgi:hypothetical protein